MSRQPTWDMALKLQADMFREVQAIGGLDVQLIYFRSYDECRASPWVSDPQALARLMTGIRCLGGFTQIRKVLAHARRELEKRKVDALVYVGDCMEEEIDHLAALAGELGLLGVPAFMFQEGRDRKAETAFKEIARLTKGAYCRFDAGSAQQLRELLRAVAAYAAGGGKPWKIWQAGCSQAQTLVCSRTNSNRISGPDAVSSSRSRASGPGTARRRGRLRRQIRRCWPGICASSAASAPLSPLCC